MKKKIKKKNNQENKKKNNKEKKKKKESNNMQNNNLQETRPAEPAEEHNTAKEYDTKNTKEDNAKNAEEYDIAILGGGPAGLGAAIYAGRFKLKTLIIAEEPGGTANKAPLVENYGGIKKIKGYELMQVFTEQAQELGAEIQLDSALRIEGKAPRFKIICNNATYAAKAILLALGTQHKKLGLPEEDKFLGKGISYCATCDATLYKGKTVAVIGGSDSACTGAMILAEYAEKVYIIYRSTQMRAEPTTIDKIKNNSKIEIIYNSNIKSINGKNSVESILLDNGKELKINGIFIEIGSIPASILAKDAGVKTDKEGYIITEPDQITNVKGIYAAGDITTNSNKFRQIITAAAEGAIAAKAIYEYLRKMTD